MTELLIALGMVCATVAFMFSVAFMFYRFFK